MRQIGLPLPPTAFAPSRTSTPHRILILDFGAQYTQLIARRVREIGVYCEIHPWDMSDDEVRAFGARGIILSGGPESTTDRRRAARAAGGVRARRAGARHLLRHADDGAAARRPRRLPARDREFGYAQVTSSAPCRLLDGLRDHSDGRAGRCSTSG